MVCSDWSKFGAMAAIQQLPCQQREFRSYVLSGWGGSTDGSFVILITGMGLLLYPFVGGESAECRSAGVHGMQVELGVDCWDP